jgi:microcystin-dependent protein
MKLYVEPGLFYIGITQVVFNGNNSPAFTAPISNPRIDILTLDSSGTLAITQGSEAASPTAPTYPTNKVVICEVYNVVSETKILDNANQSASQGYISKDARGFQSVFYIGDNSQIAAGVIQASNLANAGTVATGGIVLHSTRTAPAGWLICDGSAVSRSTYATLFSTIAPSLGTFTLTIASPAVFTLTSHGLIAGDQVYFTTTGSLPTGLSPNTIYYVISSGLTTNNFEVSATRGGSAVNTSGSQSGTHTAWFCPFGLGDGSTTFNVPDLRANVALGFKSGDPNASNLGITGGATTTTFTPNLNVGTYGNGSFGGGLTFVNSVAGASTSASIVPPFITLNYIIKT